jgi:hypothetical protein
LAFEHNRLIPLKKQARTVRFATYDIEATDWNNFLMGGVFDGTKYWHFSSIDNMCRMLLSRHFIGWTTYAHFGGGYDHRFLLKWILENRKDLKVTIIETNGLIMALKVYSEDKKYHWQFFDSFQVIKGSLDKLTKTFDVEHKKLSETVDRGNLIDDETTRLYLKNDCIGLWEVIDTFYHLPILEGISHKVTTASLSLATFRLNYLKDTILYKLTPEKEEFVRLSYYGGRVEIFKMVGVNVREYDVNSMYVSAMLKPLPCGSKGMWSKDYGFEEGTFAFIQARVTCPDNLHIPLLPHKFKGKLIFPTGTFTGVFPSPELKKAIELGYHVKIIKCLVFPASPFMAEFAQDVWDIRQTNPGENPLNITAKLLGNGGYGKFAQKRERETLTTEMEFEEGCREGYKLVLPEFNLWRIPSYSDSPAILPYISAAITSYARLILYDYLTMYPDKVCYCDTDSVFIEDMELPHSKELGGMKFENEFKKFVALQPKFYIAEYLKHKEKWETYKTNIFGVKLEFKYRKITKYKVRAKGFESKGLNWTIEDFEEALQHNDYKLFFQQQEKKFSKLNEALLHNDLLLLVARKRSMKTFYDKRLVNRKTWQTKPIRLEEELNK